MTLLEDSSNPLKPQKGQCTKFVHSHNEWYACEHIRRLNSEGLSLRQIARIYGPPIHFGDIQRAIKGELPKRYDKRRALGLPLLTHLAVDADLPPETLIPWNAKVVQCANPKCDIWFVRLHPCQKYCSKECRK